MALTDEQAELLRLCIEEAELVARINERHGQLLEFIRTEMTSLGDRMFAAGIPLDAARQAYSEINSGNDLRDVADWAFTHAYLSARKAAAKGKNRA